jgi:hypothetical protein
MEQSVNTFTKLVTDSHPLNTQRDIMTDAINCTTTTNGQNQMILQNFRGTDLQTLVKPDYRIVGVGVLNDIAYILSGKFDINGNFVRGEIGSFPSPDWQNLNLSNPDPDVFRPLIDQYSPLKNFNDYNIDINVLNDDSNYVQDFNTWKLNFRPDRLIEVEIQQSYDDSVNIIFTDNFNVPRLVNSRFKVSKDGKNAAIADRRQSKDTNTYSNFNFEATRLLKQSDKIVNLNFDGIIPGGSFKGGSSRFYFRYTDSDGNLTDIIEESRLVTFSYDGYGASDNENTGKAVKFTLSNLDRKFSGIRVYYSFASGETDTTTNVRELTNIYDIIDDSIEIIIFGDEDYLLLDRNLLNLDYSLIGTVKTLAQNNDQLLLGNITTKFESFDTLKEISQKLFVEEFDSMMEIEFQNSGYRDPNNVYHNLGYWAGETYEIGIVYILKGGKGLSPVCPIRGIDNFNGSSVYSVNPIFDANGFIGPLSSDTENRLGVYRTKKQRNLLTGPFNTDTMVRKFRVNISQVKFDPYIQANTDGFFFVRKPRKKDCIIQGYLCNTSQEPVKQRIKSSTFYTYNNNDNWKDYQEHLTDVRDGIGTFGPRQTREIQTKILPCPGRITEATIRGGMDLGNTFQPTFYGLPLSIQGIVSPDPQMVNQSLPSDYDMYYSFYSADAIVNAPLFASIFNNSDKGMMITDNVITAFQDNLNGSTVINTPGGFIVTNPSALQIQRLQLRSIISNPDYLNPAANGSSRVNNFVYVGMNQDAFSDKQFSSISDRNIYYMGYKQKDLVAPFKDLKHVSGDKILNTGATYSPNNLQLAKFLAVVNTNFSDYIGVTMNVYEDRIINMLQNDSNSVFNYKLYDNNTYGLSGDDIMDYDWAIQHRGIRLGVLTNIYENPNGAINSTNWKLKYSNTASDETYFAITKRFNWSEVISNIVEIADGDCFINYIYKRIMYGLGIPGLPTATNPETYQEFNRDTGLFPKGFLLPIVTENNYNASLRTLETKDLVEEAIYNKPRDFYPIETDLKKLRASRQLESAGYNHGYNFTKSDRLYFSINDRAPIINTNFSNRIMVSEVDVPGDFANGYTNFRGLNFRDYNKQLREITKLITHNDIVYCIFESGIGIVPLNQRTLMSEENGGVFVDNAQLLNSVMEIISTEYGSDQQFSVIKTDQCVYGCDLRKNTVWQISGRQFKIISDFAIQTTLREFKDRVLSNNFIPFVKANYDREKNDVIFSYYNINKEGFSTDYFETEFNFQNTEEIENEFDRGRGLLREREPNRPDGPINIFGNIQILEQTENSIGSLLFNETVGSWITKLSWSPLFMFNLENQLYSNNATANDNRIWKHNSVDVPTCYIYGEQHKFIFEFILVDNSTAQKMLNNLVVISNRVFPNRINFELLEDDYDFNNLLNSNNSSIQLLKQRYEYKPSVGWNVFTTTFPPTNAAYFTLESDNGLNEPISREEAERLVGGYIEFNGIIYIIGSVYENNGVFYNEILNQNGNNIIGVMPLGWTFDRVQFGIIQQNMDYVEDHLYIEVNNEDNKSRVRDKAIKIKFVYEGYDYVTIQAIVSKFLYSFN